MKKVIFSAARFLFFVLVVLPPAFAEDVKVTTSYPSPYGVYKKVSTTSDTNLATDPAAKVGIGTTDTGAALQAKLDVRGDAILVPRNTADPAGVNGMVYYNTVSNKFRNFQDGSWTDMSAGGGVAYNTVTTPFTSGGHSGTLSLMVNGRNICEDDDGCSFRIWAISASAPAGALFYNSSALMFRQKQVDGVHYWHSANGDNTGINGDLTPKQLFTAWTSGALSLTVKDDADPIGSATNYDNVTDNSSDLIYWYSNSTTTYHYVITISDN